MGAGNSAVVVDLPRWGLMLSPRVPNLVPIPGPRMSMASGICPVADSRTARSWPTELPGGGQVFCP